MILGDYEIQRRLDEGSLGISGATPDRVGPASVDLTLSSIYRTFAPHAQYDQGNYCSVGHEGRWVDRTPGSIDVIGGIGGGLVAEDGPGHTEYTVRRDARAPSGVHSEFDLVHGISLDPGDFILASTVEVVTLPDDLAARVEGKSSVGRLGITTHVTAGFIDPGFSGAITLEIANLSPARITLHPGMEIAQIAFFPVLGPVLRPYPQRGHYTEQATPEPVESRYVTSPVVLSEAGRP